jgi:hypothetical protein
MWMHCLKVNVNVTRVNVYSVVICYEMPLHVNYKLLCMSTFIINNEGLF